MKTHPKKKKKQKKTLSQPTIYVLVLLVIVLPLCFHFARLIVRHRYVDQHFEKVSAVIVRQETDYGRGSKRIYHYHFVLNEQSYQGKTSSGVNLLIGDVGDTIVIRCRVEHPNISYLNPDDNRPIKHLSYEEVRELDE